MMTSIFFKIWTSDRRSPRQKSTPMFTFEHINRSSHVTCLKAKIKAKGTINAGLMRTLISIHVTESKMSGGTEELRLSDGRLTDCTRLTLPHPSPPTTMHTHTHTYARFQRTVGVRVSFSVFPFGVSIARLPYQPCSLFSSPFPLTFVFAISWERLSLSVSWDECNLYFHLRLPLHQVSIVKTLFMVIRHIIKEPSSVSLY